MRAADDAGAEGALRRALSAEDDPAVRWRIAQRLARLLRRAGRWGDLLALWEREVGGRGAWRARALVEASKVLQRRLRLPDRALEALEEASGVTELLLVRGDLEASGLDEEVQSRLARLRPMRSRTAQESSPASPSTNRAIPE
jgi:hypothetical protein